MAPGVQSEAGATVKSMPLKNLVHVRDADIVQEANRAVQEAEDDISVTVTLSPA